MIVERRSEWQEGIGRVREHSPTVKDTETISHREKETYHIIRKRLRNKS
jgi:hypothetical protein